MLETKCKRVHSEVAGKCLLRQCDKKRTTADVAPWNQVCIKTSPRVRSKNTVFSFAWMQLKRTGCDIPQGDSYVRTTGLYFEERRAGLRHCHILLKFDDWSFSRLSREACLQHFVSEVYCIMMIVTSILTVCLCIFVCVCLNTLAPSPKDKHTVIQSCF